MNAEDLIQDLASKIYDEPFRRIREEADFPNLENPLHLVVLLCDCDIEIDMNGMLGFLENNTGCYLEQTIVALNMIGATKSAQLFSSIRDCMKRHGVAWNRLRGDFEGSTEFEITSFQKQHGESLNAFAEEVCQLAKNFALFNRHHSLEDTFKMLCEYIQERIEFFQEEIKRKVAA